MKKRGLDLSLLEIQEHMQIFLNYNGIRRNIHDEMFRLIPL